MGVSMMTVDRLTEQERLRAVRTDSTSMSRPSGGGRCPDATFVSTT
ncbi:MAG: hypothetical protein M3Q23_13635 [Actinomycetota bacterium]|nr:hypothetical protein [Actinomycetota bacterium]